MAGPCTGLRVLDLASTMAGAVATMLLADFGARVTMIQPPQGHPLGNEEGFRVWRRGKTPLTADLSTVRGRRAVRDLAARVDVLVDDLPPGELERLGLEPAALAVANPRLIHASITACGTRGPWRDLPADEALVLALSGTMRRQPGFREGPVYFVLPLASYAAALLALHGIGAALVRRGTQGVERESGDDPIRVPRSSFRVETSLLAGALAQNGSVFIDADTPPPVEPRLRHPLGELPLYRLYQCQDGRWLHLGGLTPRFWPNIAIAVDRPDLISDPRFQNPPRMATHDARRDLVGMLAAEFDRRPFAEWDRILDEHDVPYAPALTVDEFRQDPQLRVQELVITVDDPDVGPMEQLGPVIKFGVRNVDCATAHGASSAPVAPVQTRDVGGTPAGRTQATIVPQPAIRNPQSPDQSPLAGVSVIDVSGFIAGAYGSAFLADLGGDVIKVEGPEGDGLRRLFDGFLAWNRGKRGVCLDLRTEAGRAAYLRLTATADVVLENMRPGVADRLGVGYEAIRQLNPQVVYCHVSAYGTTGPYRHKPGVDPLMQARSGIERAQGGLEGPPVFLLPPVTDNTAAMLNTLGILFGLFHRQRTGEGQFVETSLLAAAALLQSDSLTAYEGRPPRPANDPAHIGPHALRRLYRCRDGWLMLACQDERDWRALCGALGRPAWRDDQRFATPEARAANQRALAEALGARFAGLRLERVLAAFQRRRIPCAPATGACETVDDPQLVENGYTAEFPHAILGRVRQSAGLTRVNGCPPASTRTAPLLGEHTREVLAEYGFAPEEIDALIDSGAAVQTDAVAPK
jgi:crotonobetainyl-CoA:carnitine CoA-transferase CaiB-like acyl-CoA transferase